MKRKYLPDDPKVKALQREVFQLENAIYHAQKRLHLKKILLRKEIKKAEIREYTG